MQILDVYTKKEYECKKCGAKLHYGKIAKDDGTLYTTDGQSPNGKFGKQSNVLSGAVDVNVKDRLHSCSEHFITDAIKKLESGQFESTAQTNAGFQRMDYSKFSPELVTAEEQVLWNDIIAKSAEYAILAQKKLDEYPELQNPALKGLITKLGFEVLTEYKKEKRDSETS